MFLASLVAQLGEKKKKKLPVMQESQVQSLGQRDPLKKEMTTHSRLLAWRTPQTEETCRPQSYRKESDMAEPLTFSLFRCSRIRRLSLRPLTCHRVASKSGLC